MDTRQSDPSELTNEPWARVERFLPAPKSGGRPAKDGRREIVNALLSLDRTGCQWRALPQDFPPWDSAYWYFRIRKRDGTLDRLRDELRGDLRRAEGHSRQPSAAIIDSRSVKATENGGRRASEGAPVPGLSGQTAPGERSPSRVDRGILATKRPGRMGRQDAPMPERSARLDESRRRVPRGRA